MRSVDCNNQITEELLDLCLHVAPNQTYLQSSNTKSIEVEVIDPCLKQNTKPTVVLFLHGFHHTCFLFQSFQHKVEQDMFSPLVLLLRASLWLQIH